MSVASLIKERSFWLQFIKEYEQLPCLWDENNINYSSRKIRELALNSLLKKVRKVWPAAQLDFVKQRISNFRRTFINEYNKVQECKKSGKHRYVPNLYYYNHLKFLKQDDTGPAPEHEEVLDEESHFPSPAVKDEFQDQAIGDFSRCKVDFIMPQTAGSLPTNEFYLVHSSNNEDFPRPSKRQRLVEEFSEGNAEDVDSSEYHLEEVSENVVNPLEAEPQQYKRHDKTQAEFAEVEIVRNVPNCAETVPMTQVSAEDEFDVIAKRVAMHFRKMNQQQCLYAEKLVFDVCISGRLNRLTEDSTLLVSSSSISQGNESILNS